MICDLALVLAAECTSALDGLQPTTDRLTGRGLVGDCSDHAGAVAEARLASARAALVFTALSRLELNLKLFLASASALDSFGI
jgi:hypothetical protein